MPCPSISWPITRMAQSMPLPSLTGLAISVRIQTTQHAPQRALDGARLTYATRTASGRPTGTLGQTLTRTPICRSLTTICTGNDLRETVGMWLCKQLLVASVFLLATSGWTAPTPGSEYVFVRDLD